MIYVFLIATVMIYAFLGIFLLKKVNMTSKSSDLSTQSNAKKIPKDPTLLTR